MVCEFRDDNQVYLKISEVRDLFLRYRIPCFFQSTYYHFEIYYFLFYYLRDSSIKLLLHAQWISVVNYYRNGYNLSLPNKIDLN